MTLPNDWEALRDGVLHVLERCRGLFPEDRRLNFVDYVYAGEWGLALEDACSNLGDFDALVGDELFAEIEQLGVRMGLRDDYWKRLRRTPYRG